MADKQLSPRQEKFVDNYVGGKTAAEAARAAGYAPAYAQRAASTLVSQPAVASAISERRADLQDATKLSLEAFDELLRERSAIAVQKNQMNAAAKYDEMRGKIHGYLDERLRVELRTQIDVRAALAEAQGRVAARIIDTTATPVSESDAAHKLLED